MEPWGTPANTFSQVEQWPFRITLWNLFDKQLLIRFDRSLNNKPSCQTLSNALEISRTCVSREGDALKLVNISWARSWDTKESCLRKPDWPGDSFTLFPIHWTDIFATLFPIHWTDIFATLFPIHWTDIFATQTTSLYPQVTYIQQMITHE